MDDSAKDDDRELERDIAETLGGLPSWDATAPSTELRDRVLSIDSSAAPAAPAYPVGDGRRRPVWTLVAAAAACLAVGAGLALVVDGVVTAPPRGPAGTLGAVEAVDFIGEPAGASVDGDLIAHTWGTETALRLDGLEAGATYTIVVVSRDGEEVDAGTILGTDGVVTCRMNAAVLRQDVAEVVVRAADASEFSAAAVSPVS